MKRPGKMTRLDLIEEYKLICKKESTLSRKNRDIVEALIARMHKAGRVTIEELKP
jgi:hypothetical protein